MKKIMDQYKKKPEGWSVLIDHKGNILVLGPRIGYKLKLITLNPRVYWRRHENKWLKGNA